VKPWPYFICGKTALHFTEARILPTGRCSTGEKLDHMEIIILEHGIICEKNTRKAPENLT